jgi:hypothetical protein
MTEAEETAYLAGWQACREHLLTRIHIEQQEVAEVRQTFGLPGNPFWVRFEEGLARAMGVITHPFNSPRLPGEVVWGDCVLWNGDYRYPADEGDPRETGVVRFIPIQDNIPVALNDLRPYPNVPPCLSWVFGLRVPLPVASPG